MWVVNIFLKNIYTQQVGVILFHVSSPVIHQINTSINKMYKHSNIFFLLLDVLPNVMWRRKKTGKKKATPSRFRLDAAPYPGRIKHVERHSAFPDQSLSLSFGNSSASSCERLGLLVPPAANIRDASLTKLHLRCAPCRAFVALFTPFVWQRATVVVQRAGFCLDANEPGWLSLGGLSFDAGPSAQPTTPARWQTGTRKWRCRQGAAVLTAAAEMTPSLWTTTTLAPSNRRTISTIYENSHLTINFSEDNSGHINNYNDDNYFYKY